MVRASREMCLEGGVTPRKIHWEGNASPGGEPAKARCGDAVADCRLGAAGGELPRPGSEGGRLRLEKWAGHSLCGCHPSGKSASFPRIAEGGV